MSSLPSRVVRPGPFVRLAAALVLAAVAARARRPPCPPASPRPASPPACRTPPPWRSRPTAGSSSASRAASCASSRTAPLLPHAVPDRDRQLRRRARPARRRLRPELRDQPVRLRLLHGHHAGHPQPRQPLHRQRRRGRRRAARSMLLDLEQPERRHQPQRRRASTSARTASSTSPSATTRTAPTPRRWPTCSARSCASTPTAPSPTDNPFFDTRPPAPTARSGPSGLRNPFTFAFQPGTGRMFINDVGQNTWEEINDGIAGANYGWPTTEGPTTDPGHRGPLFAYGHGSRRTTGCAITGGAFYNPATQQFPADVRRATTSSPTSAAAGSAASIPAPAPPPAFATGIAEPGRPAAWAATAASTTWRAAPALGLSASPSPPTRRRAITHASREPDRLRRAAGHLHRRRLRHRAAAATSGSATAPTSPARPPPTLHPRGRDAWPTTARTFRGRRHQRASAPPPATPPTLHRHRQQPAHRHHHRARRTARCTAPARRSATRARAPTPRTARCPPSAFTWQVDFHHDTHTHPFVPATSGSHRRHRSPSPPRARRRPTSGTAST